MTRQHAHEIEIAAPPAAVWQALTEPATLTNWLPELARIEPRVDGVYWRSFGDGLDTTQVIEVFEPDRRLRLVRAPDLPGAADGLQRMWEVSFSTPLIEDYQLSAHGDLTSVRVLQEGIPDDRAYDDFFVGTNATWEVTMRRLKHYLEHHPGESRHVIGLRFRAALERTEACTRTVGPRALGISGQAGERYAATTARGTALDGELFSYEAGKQLVATIDNLDDAVLSVNVDEHGPEALVFVALATWNMPLHARDALKADWAAILATALAPATVA